MEQRQRGESGEQCRQTPGELQRQAGRRDAGNRGGVERLVIPTEGRHDPSAQQLARQPEVRRTVGMYQRIAQQLDDARQQADREGGSDWSDGARIAAQRHRARTVGRRRGATQAMERLRSCRAGT